MRPWWLLSQEERVREVVQQLKELGHHRYL